MSTVTCLRADLSRRRIAEAIAARGREPNVAVGQLAAPIVPTAIASTPAVGALAALDSHGGNRLVVLDEDRTTYVGLVCLRRNRKRICVDAALIPAQASPSRKDSDMTLIDAEATVSALVLEEPGRARIFERFAIDYCCGGNVPLWRACDDHGIEVDVVLDALAEARPAETDWTTASLSDLVAHIVDHHHSYLREELPPLQALVEKVADAHGSRHPELYDVATTFAGIAAELDSHLAKEEQMVFPACVALESGASAELPFPIDVPIAAMVHEHDDVGAAFARLRALTKGYSPPVDACNSYRAMLDRLESLELDTHEHVHEENNILFPRASALEHAA